MVLEFKKSEWNVETWKDWLIFYDVREEIDFFKVRVDSPGKYEILEASVNGSQTYFWRGMELIPWEIVKQTYPCTEGLYMLQGQTEREVFEESLEELEKFYKQGGQFGCEKEEKVFSVARAARELIHAGNLDKVFTVCGVDGDGIIYVTDEKLDAVDIQLLCMLKPDRTDDLSKKKYVLRDYCNEEYRDINGNILEFDTENQAISYMFRLYEERYKKRSLYEKNDKIFQNGSARKACG